MTDFNCLVEMLELSSNTLEVESDIVENEKVSSNLINPDTVNVYSPFDIDKFGQELHEKSAVKNQLYYEAAQNINAYDLSQNCIRDVVYKLSNTPVESFADKWLPILMRAALGNAVHEFIQENTSQFTEKEVSMKIPSIRCSVRLDGLIGPHILVEIKSCTYSDYEKIIVSRRPRTSDFYQAMAYKYLIENHLEEIKKSGDDTRTKPPVLDSYDIQTVQFIYVAHDVVATDVESFAEMIQRIKDLKKALNSKSNTFFFITTLVVNVMNNIADSYITYIKNKLERINYYLTNNKIPGFDDEFVDKSKCFFCLYKKICQPNG